MSGNTCNSSMRQFEPGLLGQDYSWLLATVALNNLCIYITSWGTRRCPGQGKIGTKFVGLPNCAHPLNCTFWFRLGPTHNSTRPAALYGQPDPTCLNPTWPDPTRKTNINWKKTDPTRITFQSTRPDPRLVSGNPTRPNPTRKKPAWPISTM